MVETRTLELSFQVAPAAPAEPTPGRGVRAHPAFVGRVGSQREWKRKATTALLLYGALFVEPHMMTRSSMAGTRRMRSQQRVVQRRAERRRRRDPEEAAIRAILGEWRVRGRGRL